MKKIFILFSLIFISILLISQASAFFGCSVSQYNQGHIWKDDNRNFHLVICFTPTNHVNTLLSQNLITYNSNTGELQANYNLKKDANEDYEVYIEKVPIKTIISAISRSDFVSAKSDTHIRKITEMLNILSLFIEEDGISEINYVSPTLFLDWNGVILKGDIKVPRYNDEGGENVMYAGEIISKHYTNDMYISYSQIEFQISGIEVEFFESNRELIWIDQTGYLDRADRNNKLQDRFTAKVGTKVRYKMKEKTIELIRGILYKNGEEIKNSLVKFVPEEETKICCLTNINDCVTATSKEYPLELLSNATCNFGIENFDISYHEENEETIISEQATKIIYRRNIDDILELIRIV